jgi:dTDP-glucose 4,6-dehydratase
MASEAASATILVTGGAGFIGTNFVLGWCAGQGERIVNLDKLTYAGNAQNLDSVASTGRHRLVVGDIADRPLVRETLRECRPVAIINFAAESHVDRSIHGPEDFIQTNLVGTFHLLEEARAYWQTLSPSEAERFRFLHVSTDEVYGSLGPDDAPFTETTSYAPNSPYSASKAGSDHLVRAYFHTYGFPSLTTNCSNNYGPYQFPEKLIPLIIMNALSGKPLPVYGDGQNIRDWLYVEDHCAAIRTVLARGKPGETYNVSGDSERRNIDVVSTICKLLDELHPHSPVVPHEGLVTYVKDRPGHDRRYAMNATKLRTSLGWQPIETFESGIRKTIRWYLDRPEWVTRMTTGGYREWMQLNYGNRLPA